MKKSDLVVLKNDKPYIESNLKKGMHGIVVSSNGRISDVLFFNPENRGDYLIAKINANDVDVEKERLPYDLAEELNEKLKNSEIKSKNHFKTLKIKAYDMVELTVEDAKYSKYGIHKGDRGCVMDDYAVKNYIEVDFSGIDKNGNYYGNCISVKVEDLKVVTEP